mmetsp:Transcript_128490/g.357680  ORF Transcript_128490/g.357680 Transcript_128490/m.357680 type:complete len:226 (-) Transcript_128490:120-797(-)
MRRTRLASRTEVWAPQMGAARRNLRMLRARHAKAPTYVHVPHALFAEGPPKQRIRSFLMKSTPDVHCSDCCYLRVDHHAMHMQRPEAPQASKLQHPPSAPNASFSKGTSSQATSNLSSSPASALAAASGMAPAALWGGEQALESAPALSPMVVSASVASRLAPASLWGSEPPSPPVPTLSLAKVSASAKSARHSSVPVASTEHLYDSKNSTLQEVSSSTGGPDFV